MKKHLPPFLIISLILFCNPMIAGSVVKEATPLKLMSEIFPPFQYEDNGETIGISIDIVKAIQNQINAHSKIIIYPWARGLKFLNKKKNSALFSTLRTPEREDLYKWVGPLTTMQMVFFKKKGSKLNIKSMADAKKVARVGVTNNVANHQMMEAKGFTNLDVISSGADEKNIKKLIKGRIDLWPALKMSGLYNARKMGLAGEIVAIDNVIVFTGDLYIAFNKKTEDKVIRQWQSALDKLVASGKITEIKNHYK